MRRVGIALLSLALLAAAAACGASKHAADTSVARAPEPVSHPAEATASWVHVTVVDGDRGDRVPGALVRIGKRARVSDGRGIAKIKLKRRAALVVAVKRRGYSSARQRFQFRNHPLHTIRIYQPALQWTMYGVNAGW